jgi:sporulation protein YlmC with PRC-barrel domain
VSTVTAVDRDGVMPEDGQAEAGDDAAEQATADDQAKVGTAAVTAVVVEPKGGDTNPFEVMSASELLGSEVVNERGDTVAEVVDLVKDGDVTYAVLSVGGFLGIGDKEVAMPLDRFEVDAEERIMLLARPRRSSKACLPTTRPPTRR